MSFQVIKKRSVCCCFHRIFIYVYLVGWLFVCLFVYLFVVSSCASWNWPLLWHRQQLELTIAARLVASPNSAIICPFWFVPFPVRSSKWWLRREKISPFLSLSLSVWSSRLLTQVTNLNTFPPANFARDSWSWRASLPLFSGYISV